MSAKSILLVEDDETDAYLIQRSFRALPFEHDLEIAEDGVSALQKLESRLASDTLPDLVLLDLHMPGMNGFEVLEKIRTNDQYQDLRVVVLTGADSDDTLLKAYECGATSYAVKPQNRLEFRHFVAEIAEWWTVKAA